MLPMLTKYTLMLTQDFFIIPFVLVGFYFINRRFFSEALMLVMVAAAINTYLKFTFKIDLPPGINAHTYAFPSGHMTSTIVLWGWLAMRLNKKWMNALSFALIAAIGFSLVYKGYHNWVDIAGSAITGILIIFLGTVTLASAKDEYLPLVGVGLGIISIALIKFLPKTQAHLWMGPGVIFATSLAVWLQNKDGGNLSTYFYKTAAVSIAIFGIVVLYYVMPYAKPHMAVELFNATKFGLITFWSLYISDALVKKGS